MGTVKAPAGEVCVAVAARPALGTRAARPRAATPRRDAKTWRDGGFTSPTVGRTGARVPGLTEEDHSVETHPPRGSARCHTDSARPTGSAILDQSSSRLP